MHSIFFKNNKKGTWTLKEVIILFFAAFLIIATFGFFNELQAAFFSQKDDGSIANFERLYSTEKELMESTDAKDYRTINYFIGKNKVLVGFDTDWKGDKEKIVDKFIWDSVIYKPFKCGNAACLCLYTDDWKPDDAAKRDKGVIECLSSVFSGKNIVFLSEGDDKIEPRTAGLPREDIKGNYLVFYGKDWGTKPIYIEKIYKDGKYYIYISKINLDDSKDPANIRKKEIDKSRK